MTLKMHTHNPALPGASSLSCFLLPVSSSSELLSKPNPHGSTFPFWDLIYPLVVSLHCQQHEILNHHGNMLGLCLWGCFQEGLTEQRRTTLNVDNIIPWAGVLDSIKMEKVNPTPTSIPPYGLITDFMWLSLMFLLHQLWAKTCNPLNCFCQESFHSNENSK